MNFLIDECLHTSLVEVAVERGHVAATASFHITYCFMDTYTAKLLPLDYLF